MTHDELRSIVIECLKKPRPYDPSAAPYQVTFLFSEVAETAKKRDLKLNAGGPNAWLMNHDRPELHSSVMPRVWDIVWDLIVESIIRPGTGDGEPYDLPCIHVTEYGRKALADESMPHDPEGYLKGLRERVPKLDPTILVYLAESAETLRRNCLLSSTVTLGCASEQAMLLVIEKTADACGPAKKPAFETTVKDLRSIKQQNEEYRKWFNANLRVQLKQDKGTDWLTSLENALSLLFNYFRTVRNDAGHPTGARISREEATGHLKLFPRYLELLYDLMDWLDAEKPI